MFVWATAARVVPRSGHCFGNIGVLFVSFSWRSSQRLETARFLRRVVVCLSTRSVEVFFLLFVIYLITHLLPGCGIVGNSALRFLEVDGREIPLLVAVNVVDEEAELSKDLWATATAISVLRTGLAGGCPSDCGQAVDNALRRCPRAVHMSGRSGISTDNFALLDFGLGRMPWRRPKRLNSGRLEAKPPKAIPPRDAVFPLVCWWPFILRSLSRGWFGRAPGGPFEVRPPLGCRSSLELVRRVPRK